MNERVEGMLGLGIYTPEQAVYAAAEVDYFEAWGELPEWSIYIEAIDVVNGALIIVHRDMALEN